MISAAEFLSPLWGAGPDGSLDGVNYIATPSNKHDGFDHFPVKTIAEAVDMALGLSTQGRNAYFACAEYLTTLNRKAENAKGAWAFWLDIDCGEKKAKEGKGYLNKPAAVKALNAFCTAAALPEPSIVGDSGNGLHCYWHFSEFINREEWRALARKLKALAAKHGLLADPSRTADIASVLRVPETLNCKDPANPKPVTIKLFDGPLSLAVFMASLDAAMPDSEGLGAPLANVGAMLGSNIEKLPPSPETPEEIARVQSMLAAIPADCDRDTWRNICWAVLATGWQCAGNLARDWSMTAPDKFDEGDFQKIIASYKPDGGTGFGTLVHHAKQHGWMPPVGIEGERLC
jgi:hypothetical protein